MLAYFGGELEHVLEARAVFECALAGALDDGTIRKRIAERNAEFDDTCARFNGRENDFARGREIGISAGYVGDERRLAFEVEGHGIWWRLSHQAVGLFVQLQTPNQP